MSSLPNDRAVRAAVSVAAEYGLRCTEPVVLGRMSNVLVHLAPHPVVARVAGIMGDLRDGAADWLAREVAVVRHLGGRGAVTVSRLPPGPHLCDGLALTFVALERPDPAAVLDPAETGMSLRRLHEGLRGLELELPRLGLLDECATWWDRLSPDADLSEETLARLRDRHAEVRAAVDGLESADQVLHGDAHAGNVMATPRGLVWTDFEDVTAGPPLWDLACLAARARVLGEGEGGYGPEWADAAIRAYGADPRDPRLDLLVTARTLVVAAWALSAGAERTRLRAAGLDRVRWLLTEGSGAA
ncbi:aminoglycoside phosphotransferase family protein [Streptomyces sp. NPDC002055]|uniref:phosphotransferase family protein n=1 Tax=Streptomyces sp. NPDC002055 TaxID=3154534 RepID=UPI00333373D0